MRQPAKNGATTRRVFALVLELVQARLCVELACPDLTRGEVACDLWQALSIWQVQTKPSLHTMSRSD